MKSEISYKCRACHGEVIWEKGASIGECIYCGSRQPIPSNFTTHIQDMYNDAFEYLKKNEYDKAFVVYENIIRENPNDAEAYWGRCLCRYGIEYVDDPNTGKKIPTCHRLQAKSILKDEDYLAALKYAPDESAKSLYTMRATNIDIIQRDIIAISQGEEGKYDIFISFKDTDDNENRTKDSHLAESIYNELTKQGYRVFFSRVTLAQKLGAVYEPYIYAAIHSAKIMIVVGTKPEYIESTWVRNEWSRYLDLIREGKDKRLIVCFKDMSRKALPEEFVPFQNLDMNERGSVPTLIQNVGTIIKPPKKEKEKKEEKGYNAPKEKPRKEKKQKKRGCVGCLIPLLLVLCIIAAGVYFSPEPLKALWEQLQSKIGTIDLPSIGSNALVYNDLYYEDAGDYVKIVGYKGSASDLTIPSTIDGKPVGTIVSGAFKNCSTLQTVTVPESVTVIGLGAFYGCNGITEMTLPFVGNTANATEARWAVFGYIFGDGTPDDDKMDCVSKEYTTSGSSGYTSQSYSSNNSSSMFYFAIPKSLRKVTVTNQAKIPEYAFQNCDLIREITFTSSVRDIGLKAFQNCSSLRTCIFEVSDSTIINQYAFQGCRSLTDYSIPKGVIRISAYAFDGCTALQTIDIPDTVETISNCAFKNCASVTLVVVPDSVTAIGGSAFHGCNALTEITLPFVGKTANATETRWAVFGYIFGDNEPDDDDMNYRYREEYTTSGSSGYTSQSYKDSKSYIFYFVIPKSLRKVTITNQTKLPDYAFQNCDLIREVTFVKAVEMIGVQAFENCSSLKTISYGGTKSQWNSIVLGSDWKKNANDFEVIYNEE